MVIQDEYVLIGEYRTKEYKQLIRDADVSGVFKRKWGESVESYRIDFSEDGGEDTVITETLASAERCFFIVTCVCRGDATYIVYVKEHDG